MPNSSGDPTGHGTCQICQPPAAFDIRMSEQEGDGFLPTARDHEKSDRGASLEQEGSAQDDRSHYQEIGLSVSRKA